MADDEDPEPTEETYEALRDLLYRLRHDAMIDDETLTVLLDDRARTATRAGRRARAGAGR